MSTSLLVAKERQLSSPFGLGHKQAKKPKNYGANAPQLHPILKKYGANAPQLRAIRCSIDFQIWLSGFAAMCRSTTVGMASLLRKQESSKEKRGER